MAGFRVAVDIGGTFTDIVFLDADGALHTKKISSSVDNYARAIAEGLEGVFQDTGLRGADVDEVPRTQKRRQCRSPDAQGNRAQRLARECHSENLVLAGPDHGRRPCPRPSDCEIWRQSGPSSALLPGICERFQFIAESRRISRSGFAPKQL